ncbi:hypothetical protein BH11MYX1_BH11MYX1_19610 [soil metagenome]
MRLLAVVVVLAGCGGGIAAPDFAKELRDAECDLRVRCGELASVASCDGFFAIADETVLLAEIGGGKVNYDSDKAEQCVNAIKNASCDGTTKEARETPPACKGFISGTLAMGATCFTNEECASAACAMPSCTAACCAGTCSAVEPPGKAGDPCATRACGAGLTCDNTKKCVALFAAGAPCTLYTECDYGLGCLGDPGICGAMPHLGDACPDGQCAELGSYCTTDKLCAPLGLLGDACATASDCARYYTCEPQSLACTRLPVMGEPCTGLCSDGSYCDSATTTCTALLANGSACMVDRVCKTGYCDATLRACAALPICD